MVIIISFILIFLFIDNKYKRVEYSKETINEYIQKIEKYTNEKDRKKLERVVKNEVAVRQLFEDFSDEDMIVKNISYYNLTETVLRVELQCELKATVKTYLIMIDNKDLKWETYVTGFI